MADSRGPKHPGGMNAQEIRSARELASSDWAKVHSEYRQWRKHLGGDIPWGWIALTVIGIVIRWAFSDGWLHSAGTMLAIAGGVSVFHDLVKAEGHREGYMEGFEAGFEGGCNRMLGLSDEDAAQIDELARDMDLDDMLNRHTTPREGSGDK